MTEKFSLKDALFNPQKIKYLADLVDDVYVEFDKNSFVRDIVVELPSVELKQRTACICANLQKYLPADFIKSVQIILKSLPKELDINKTDADFGDFIFAPFGEFVAKNGLQKGKLKISFNALAEITKRFSVEFAMRDFINKYPLESFEFLCEMAISRNYHQRRLASECLRPKLPWATGIDFDYKKPLEILDKLYFDNTRFVVRSVANHLNDIAKIDAYLVVKTLQKWQQENKQNGQEFEFLSKHALRTLLKKGDKNALNFLGFCDNPQIEITLFKIKNSTIVLGDYLEFEFNIFCKKAQKLMIDYIVYYPNSTQKVFKIKQVFLENSLKINKKHLFRQMTTKKLYAGKYKIALQINGNILTKNSFSLSF